MLKIQPIHDKKIWDAFLQKTSSFPFFQSWEWGDVQQLLQTPVERLGIYRGDTLLGVVQIVVIHARRGTYLHLRHGPVFLEQKKEYYDFLFSYLKQLAKKEQAAFIRFSPLLDQKTASEYFFKPYFLDAPIHRMDAEVCWVLDITSSEEAILAGMRKSHRYLIRKALQGNDIKIHKTTDPKDMDKFLPLYKHLAQRKHFVAHKGVKEEFSIFAKEKEGVLFFAEYQGKIISGALIDFVGDMAIYRHSASDEAYRNIPAMYLLQWEVIKEAKKRGMRKYNFWGIAPLGAKNHPWQGLTLFKTGFGGSQYEYMHAKDMPLSPLYLKTFLIEYISKLKKGY